MRNVDECIRRDLVYTIILKLGTLKQRQLRKSTARSMKVKRGSLSKAPSRSSLIRFLTSLSSKSEVKLLRVSGDRIFSLLKLRSRTSRAFKPCSDEGNSVRVLCDAWSSLSLRSKQSKRVSLALEMREKKMSSRQDNFAHSRNNDLTADRQSTPGLERPSKVPSSSNRSAL